MFHGESYVVEFAVFVNIFVATCILTRRLYVIWGDNKKVTLVVCLLFAAITISSIIMFALAYSSNKDDLGGRIGSVVECIEVSPLNWVELFLFLLYESGMRFLTTFAPSKTDLYVTYSFVYFIGDFEKNLLVSNSDGRYLPLLKILIDDGLAYYSYSISLALVDIAMFFFPKLRVLAVALVGIDSVLHSIISMHISIRLRHGAEATLVVDATSPFSHTNRTE
ncbi:hypothetical protein PNOK_0654300 [Pyrrhoderma noxium]|uniref:Uncharacterized protein n=1 Tax=Pyrrhoderma noxium TaxID=2282107 RepID=A0A286UEQ2_9AGAM|nr:hypothetical protein PNOK_0654300 [Pyrrhoderma noxium]